MKTDRRQATVYVLAVVIVGLALWLVVDTVKGMVSEPSSKPPTVVSSTTTTARAPTTTAGTVEVDESELLEVVSGFVDAYFKRLPDDDSDSYLARLQPYASQQFRDQLSLDIFEQEPFLAMSRAGNSVMASFEDEDVQLSYDPLGQGTVWAETRLDLMEVQPDGTSHRIRAGMVFTSAWRLVDGRWQVYPSLPR